MEESDIYPEINIEQEDIKPYFELYSWTICQFYYQNVIIKKQYVSVNEKFLEIYYLARDL